MTAADELRAAAEKLRALSLAAEADVAANPYWRSDLTARPDWYANGVRNGLGGESGELAAAMHPGVGTALADWLDTAGANADALTWPNQFVESALAVARAILGSQS
ncbi:hypothetical protein ACODT3_10650 [Streptomyces sp. 4.24]|uniref:hypothetical protein n=1 Tax=Streptomyces tritrimontium TaxID=3406573 RepID=UPI003BB5A4F0